MTASIKQAYGSFLLTQFSKQFNSEAIELTLAKCTLFDP
jgi:hypothetical protein